MYYIQVDFCLTKRSISITTWGGRAGTWEAVSERASEAARSGGGMEVEVRVVGGARSCFVALPLHLIHALERTSASGDLPPVLALELRGPAGGRWSLAWSGAASRSRAIEVSGPQPAPLSRSLRQQ